MSKRGCIVCETQLEYRHYWDSRQVWFFSTGLIKRCDVRVQNDMGRVKDPFKPYCAWSHEQKSFNTNLKNVEKSRLDIIIALFNFTTSDTNFNLSQQL